MGVVLCSLALHLSLLCILRLQGNGFDFLGLQFIALVDTQFLKVMQLGQPAWRTLLQILTSSRQAEQLPHDCMLPRPVLHSPTDSSVWHAVHHHWLSQHQSALHGWVSRHRAGHGQLPAQSLCRQPQHYGQLPKGAGQHSHSFSIQSRHSKSCSCEVYSHGQSCS